MGLMRTVRYVLPARVLHWLMAAGFVFMWICGFYMTRFPEDDSPLQGFLYGLHISVGVTLLALLAARIAVRMRNTPPALPIEIPPLERRAAELGHIALYVLPLAVIALGYAQTNLKGYAVKWFGLELPSIFDKAGKSGQELAADLHMWLAYAFLALAVAHVSGTYKHLWVDRIDLISRMKFK